MLTAPATRSDIGEEQIFPLILSFFFLQFQSIFPLMFFYFKSRKVGAFKIDGERFFGITAIIVLYNFLVVGSIIWLFYLSSYKYGDIVAPPVGGSLEDRFSVAQSIASLFGIFLSMSVAWLCYWPEQKT